MLGLRLILGLSVRGVLDMIVAGVSLAIGFGFWVFVTSVLCSVAFFRCAKQAS
ncbi:hypothetical protein BT93_L5077 [Corymbia citriodora subsp. variegata]|uniref:Uncharacterized protein n=1 Tax=Corymbia citriodora subsp. variegata TaxID=360336 RepID=A0A8T0CSW1_CORYI|nr:hypothetical protein BT93_L5077 [Corymbia citriodora subsp. variegata]